MADDFCKFLDALIEKYTVKSDKSGIITETQPCQKLNHADHDIISRFRLPLSETFFPKKPCINVQRTLDTQLALF